MTQDELARELEKIDEANLGDGEINRFEQVRPAIGLPKQHLETRAPARVVALSKENAPGLSDHSFDIQAINTAVAGGGAVVLINFLIPKGVIAVCKYFGWSTQPAGFADITFQIFNNQTVFPGVVAAVPNVYLPSANTINFPDLARCYESCAGPGAFSIVATSAAVGANCSARINGYYWQVGPDEKEIGDRIYDRYTAERR